MYWICEVHTVIVFKSSLKPNVYSQWGHVIKVFLELKSECVCY